MVKQMEEPVSRPAAAVVGSWRSRLPAWRPRLALRWPQLARWQLIALAVVAFLLVLLSGTTLGLSTSYSAQIFVVEGGAIGLPPPLERLDFGDAPRGVVVERKIGLENNSPIPLRVFVFAMGDIRDFITVDDAFFRLGPGDEHTIVVEARPPASAEAKKYEGRVVVVQMPWPFPW